MKNPPAACSSEVLSCRIKAICDILGTNSRVKNKPSGLFSHYSSMTKRLKCPTELFNSMHRQKSSRMRLESAQTKFLINVRLCIGDGPFSLSAAICSLVP